MDTDSPGILPASTRKQYREALAKCATCAALNEYLARIGHRDEETIDRTDHAARLLSTALEIDRQAAQKG